LLPHKNRNNIKLDMISFLRGKDSECQLDGETEYDEDASRKRLIQIIKTKR